LPYSCTFKFVTVHRNRRRNAAGTVVYDQMTASVKKIYYWSLTKHKYRLRKRKAKMASTIHSHQHLTGPALIAGGPRWSLWARAENGVPSPQIFHFNHCIMVSIDNTRRSSVYVTVGCTSVCLFYLSTAAVACDEFAAGRSVGKKNLVGIFLPQNHFYIQNLLFTQPRWQPRTHSCNNDDVLSLMDLHSPSKILHKFLASFWYVCLLRLAISICVLCKECSQYYFFLLILGSVFSDYVVFYGDSG